MIKSIITSLALVSVAGISLAQDRVLPPVHNRHNANNVLLDSGFKAMFDGKDLKGWTGDPRLWSVREGAIVGETSDKNPIDGNTFLIWTNGSPGDFELRCAFRITAHNNQNFANSGIQYRSKVLDPKKWVVGGYQADMEAGANYTGILYEERMTRGIMAARGEKVVWDKECVKRVTGSLGTSAELQGAIRKGEWNEYIVIAKGNHLQHFINGKQTVDVTDECESKRADRGVIALQLHKGLPMMVEFKDLRMKDLSGNEAASTDDLKRMQGAWKVSSIEAGGQEAEKDQISELVLTVNGHEFDLANLGVPTSGSFALDASKTPKQIEIRPTTGPEAGRIMPGIYEIKDDSLRVCYSRRENKRPGSFDTGDNANLVLLTYTRKKS